MPQSSVPLDRKKHASLIFRSLEDYSFTASMNMIPLLASEVADASRCFPVVFPLPGSPIPHALLGLGPTNIFLDGGRWTAFLESDDRWHPQSLSLRLDALERSGAGVVLNDVAPLPMPGAGTAWFESYVGRVMREHAASAALAERTGGAYALRTAFLAENKIPTFSCAMIRTALLRECSPDTPVSRWLDWWIWAQAAQKTTFCFVPVKLTQWRLHRESLHNRIALGSYLRDYRNMWRGFRRQLAGSPRAFRILRQPFWLRLGARFRLMAGERGMGDALRRVFSRLDTADGERGTPHRFPQRKRAD